MSGDDFLRSAAIRHYLATGEQDADFPGWGSNFLEAARNGSAALREALVAEVCSRTAGLSSSPATVPGGVRSLSRKRLAPMVSGLFPASEQAIVLEILERAVVFLTADNIEEVLRSQSWPGTAWSLANLYLASVGVEPLGIAPACVGLNEETTCYVSIAYFEQQDEFADFVVHEAAHVFHNCRRTTIGLPETRRSKWLLDIDFRKRETFAYACEAYSCIATGDTRARRLEALARHADGWLPGDERVHTEEYLDILREAIHARNGWKRILQRCAPQRKVRSNHQAITVG